MTPIITAMTSATTLAPMKVVAYTLPSDSGRPYLATGQHRRSVNTIFSRDLPADIDNVASLNGALARYILPLTKSRESPWVLSSNNPA
jgi:hypothetical protein